MSSSRKHLLAIALALVIFLAGAAIGVLLDRAWLRHHGAHTPGGLDRAHTALLESFREHLDLTDDQVARIEDIMQRTVAEAHRIMHAEQPAMRELHDRAQREVLEVLTPEQAIEYRRMMAHHPLGPSSGH